eukprot:CAMPEP_0172307584 /NCGR_PEP_ID=MMETSP1058-20130122/8409_1 /TAXON_ID=83371 /ORGANISM="Detonula confervacea, Strain CCMP 353" /LENGTH=267 /DNA_ID=CAMNT_0013019789 /DNA_START=142 /DNA_END=945 /DNA_ORIENTATION=+
MSALLRRPAASAFIQSSRSSSRESIRFISSEATHRFHGSAAISCPIGCSPLHRGKHSPTVTSLNLLSRGFYTDLDEKNRNAMQSSQDDDAEAEYLQPVFKKGDLVMVEVIFFGPLGASVDVVGHSHNQADCIPQDEPALGRGMILQSEIDFFRRGRDGIDVVKYEILPAYVENVREEVFVDDEAEERLDISLRPPGGRAKAQELGEQILEALKGAGGVLDVGDKSSPAEINEVFPGASKGAFKKAVSALYRRGLVTPGPDSVTLVNE